MILVLLCMAWLPSLHAVALPWKVINPGSQTAFFDIHSELTSGKYEAASRKCEQAFVSAKGKDPDQLLFVITLAKIRIRQSQPEAGLRLLKWAKGRYDDVLKDKDAIAYLIEAYGELAAEVPDPEARQAIVRKLQLTYALLPESSSKRGALALRIASLLRLLNDPSSATWLDLATIGTDTECNTALRYFQERAYVAVKASDKLAAKGYLDSAATQLESCPDAMPEDQIAQHFIEHEYHYLLAELDGEDMGTLRSKLEACQGAIAVGNQMPEVHPALLDLCLYRMASIVGEMGNTEGALTYAQKALEGFQRRPYSPKNISNGFGELARWQHFLGRTEEALMNYRQALTTFPQTTPVDWRRQSTKQLNYIQALISANHFTEGEELTKVAEHDLLEHAPEDFFLRAKLHQTVGIGLAMQHKFSASVPSLLKAIELLDSMSAKPTLELAYCHAYLATSYLRLGDTTRSEEQSLSAQRTLLTNPGGTPLARASVLEVLADYLLDHQELETALDINEQFLNATLSNDAASQGIAPPPPCNGCPDIELTVSPWNTLKAVFQRVQILRAQASSTSTCELEQALKCTQRALATMYKLRRERSLEVDKLEFNKHWHVLFALGLETAQDLYRLRRDPAYLQQAFEIAEQSKAMLLMEALLENQALERDPQNAALVDKRQVLTAYISQLRKQLSDAGSSPTLSSALTTARRNLDEVNSQIQAQNPNYSDLVGAFTVITPSQLQPQLKQQQRALVEYFHADTLLHILIVTPDTVSAVVLPLSETFGEDLRHFTQSLHAYSGRDPEAELANLVASSAIVKAKVWDPIESLVRPFKRVTVIPDGPLSLLSFEALLLPSDAANAPKRLKDLRFLLDEHTISYDYSATYLASRRSEQARSDWRTLAVAPSFGENPIVSPLPNTVNGIERLAKDFSNVTALLEAEASKPSFITQAPEFDVLDIATHGSFDRGDFLQSALYFAPIGDDDSLLTVQELYRMKLRTQLAILEACESGLGDVREGEGVMSLARAFTYAGCRSVLMSLWDVAEAQSTREIMKAFYKNLCDGMPRDEAIAEAKRAFLGRARQEGGELAHLTHPYYWAEMVLIGDLTPMPKQVAKAQSSWTWIAIAGLGLMALTFVGFKFRNARRKSSNAA
ncbi:MAG: CHAT domain-containing tetratricopeptide repeat protein [Bacteroidia bacterium]